MRRSTSVCPLNVGDLILLYTDGIYEATNPQGEEFGHERFLNAIRRHVIRPAKELFDELLDEVRRFFGTREFDDDVCLVGVEISRMGIHP